MAVKETDLVPDGDSFGGADLDAGRCEWFEISIMIPRDNLYVGDHFDETLKEFRNILPLFQLNFCDRVLHIAQQDESSRMSVVDDLTELLEQARDLRGHMYSLMRQGYFPAEMQIRHNQDPFTVLLH